jgi:hypothetical protein
LPESASYLLVISDRNALAWVVREQRMAFPALRRREVTRLRPGDALLLYTTRGCFHNPTRDRGRLIGIATATSAVTDLDPAIQVAGREFPLGCDLQIERLAPLRGGVELAPLVSRLRVFPDPASWSARLRRPLLALPAGDARLLRRQIEGVAGAASEVAADYAGAAR